jgi:hypothetical protein
MGCVLRATLLPGVPAVVCPGMPSSLRMRRDFVRERTLVRGEDARRARSGVCTDTPSQADLLKIQGHCCGELQAVGRCIVKGGASFALFSAKKARKLQVSSFAIQLHAAAAALPRPFLRAHSAIR